MTDKELNDIIRKPRPKSDEIRQTNNYGLFQHYISGGFWKCMDRERMRFILDRMLEGDYKYSQAQKDKIREIKQLISK